MCLRARNAPHWRTARSRSTDAVPLWRVSMKRHLLAKITVYSQPSLSPSPCSEVDDCAMESQEMTASSPESAAAPATPIHLHLIGGEKGGVGKSVLARVLAQYFIDKEMPFTAYDTDKSHRSLQRFYVDYASPIVVDRYEALDTMMENVVQGGQRVVVDLAAQSFGLLTQWMDDSAVLDVIGDMGVAMSYWHVMDSSRDSVDLLNKVLDRFGNRLKLMVVLNEVRGTEFEILQSTGQLDRALSLGASVVRLPKLSDIAMQKIDQFNTSFWAASQMTANGNGLALFERQRVKLWLSKIYQQLDSLQI
jgi:CO dehydrogenase nickel-insertion accessory protein CooC1